MSKLTLVPWLLVRSGRLACRVSGLHVGFGYWGCQLDVLVLCRVILIPLSGCEMVDVLLKASWCFVQ
jgi:hypothetical protein